MKALLSDRNAIFAMAMVLGMVFVYPSRWTEPVLLPVLGAVMTLSVLNVPNHMFKQPRLMVVPALSGILMSYLVLTGVVLALGFLLIQDPLLRAGIIIIAAVPPAIAVIPVNSMLKGDDHFMLFAVVGSYLAALLLLPAMLFFLLDIQGSNLMRFAAAAGGLVLFPVLISRLILWMGWNAIIDPVKGRITDWLFFVVIYTIIARNRDILLENPGLLLPIAVVAFFSIFILGFLVEIIGKRLGLAGSIVTPLVLLGTLKHPGLSGGIALAFFDKETALPSAVFMVFLVLNAIWLGYRHKKVHEKQAA